MHNVAVVGCGAIGLTTAVAIQKRLNNVNVTIFTKDVSPNTTSDIAAGLWEPYLLGNTPPEKIIQWSKATYEYLLNLWKEGKANEAGICLQPCTFLVEENYVLLNWLKFTLGYSELSHSQLKNISDRYSVQFSGGFTFTTFSWESTIYLPYLQEEFIRNGGKIVKKEIQDLSQLSHFNVIVNCPGIKARELVGDMNVGSIRGQIIKARAPWQFHTFLTDSKKTGYIIANTRHVVLGGTRQPEFDLKLSEEDKQTILRNASDLVSSIKAAEIIEHQVGLRPARNQVRLESESKEKGKNRITIIHNYGHGGAGITLSIGCAEEVVGMVKDALKRKYKSKL